MRKIKFLFIIYLLITNSNLLFSQITYSKFETKPEQLISKTEPYDSIQNWKTEYQKLSANKKYIGQKIYFPKINIEKNTIEKYEREQAPFLFTKEKVMFNLDSTNTESLYLVFSKNQYNPKRYKYPADRKFFDTISTNVYKPYFDKVIEYNSLKMEFTHKNKVQDKYYLITDVIYGDRLTKLNLSTEWSFINDSPQFRKVKKDSENTDSYSNIRKINYNYKVKVVFELKDEDTGEILYFSERDLNQYKTAFILVSYFVKQKQLYKGENLILNNRNDTPDLINTINIEDENGKLITKPKMVEYTSFGKDKIWKCIDVTILEGDYEISYIMKNNNNETIALQDNTRWKFEKDILAEEKLKKENDQNIKKEREKEIQIRKLKENIIAENRKKECSAKFGAVLGEIIANHKVKIGMTKEMCKMSWGNPFWSDKTTTSTSTTENWYYGLAHSLHFEGNLLERIEE